MIRGSSRYDIVYGTEGDLNPGVVEEKRATQSRGSGTFKHDMCRVFGRGGGRVDDRRSTNLANSVKGTRMFGPIDP